MNFNLKRRSARLAWLLALSAFALVPLLAQTESKTPPPAQELLNAALKTAQAENKAVFVHFAASW